MSELRPIEPRDLQYAEEVSGMVTRSVTAPEAETFTPESQKASLLEHFMYGIPGAVAAVGETVGESFGIIDEDTMNGVLQRSAGRFGEYYNQYEEPLKFAGELPFMFVPGTLAIQSVRAGSWLNKAAMGLSGNNRLVKALFTNAMPYSQARAKIAKDVQLAMKETGAVDALASDFVRRGGRLSSGAYFPGTVKLKQDALAKGFVEGTAFELGVFATMNASDTIYPDEFEWYDHLAFAALGPGIGAASEFLFMRSTIRQAINQGMPDATKSLFSTYDYLEGAGVRIEDIPSAPLERGTRATTFGFTIAENERWLKQGIENPELRTNVSNATTQLKLRLKQEVQGAFADEYTGLSAGQKFSEPKGGTAKKASPLTDASNAIIADPSLAMGLAALDVVPTNRAALVEMVGRQENYIAKTTEKITETRERISQLISKNPNDPKIERLNEKLSLLQDHLDQAKSVVPTVLERSGQQMPLFGRKVRGYDAGIKINTMKQADKKIFTAEFTNPNVQGTKKIRTSVDEDLLPALYVDNKFQQAAKLPMISQPLFVRDIFFETYRKAIPQWIKNSQKSKQQVWANVTADTNWMRLDALLEANNRIVAEGGQDIFLSGRVARADGNMRLTADTIQFMSLQRKYDEFVGRMDARNAVASLKPNIAAIPAMDEIVDMLNLPSGAYGIEYSAVVKMFQDLYATGLKPQQFSNKFTNLSEFNNAVKQSLKFPDDVIQAGDIAVPDFAAKKIDDELKVAQLSGNAMEPLPHSNSIVFWRKQFEDSNRSMIEFAKAQVSEQLHRYNDLDRAVKVGPLGQMEPESAVLVKEIFDEFKMMPGTLQAAKNVRELGTGTVTSPSFTQLVHATRDSSVMQAAEQVGNVVENTMRNVMNREIFHDAALDAFALLRNNANKPDLYLYNLYSEAKKMGWKLDADYIVSGTNGRYNYKLDMDEKRNKQLWARFFPDEEVPEVAYLPDPVQAADGIYAPLSLTALAERGRMFINAADEFAFRQNAFMAGREGRQYFPKFDIGHMPPEQYRGKELAFLIKQGGVEGFTKYIVAADNVEQLQRKLGSKRIKDLENDGYTLYRPGSVAQHFDFDDKLFFAMEDFTDAFAQTGAPKGTSARPVIPTSAEILDGHVDAITRNVYRAGHRALFHTLKPQLEFAGSMHKATHMMEKGRKTIAGVSPWQLYVDTLLGKQNINRPSVLSTVYRGIEGAYDTALAGLYTKMHDVGLINGSISNTIVETVKGGRAKEFDRMKAALGEHLPFDNAVEYAASTYNVPLPPSMKGQASWLNEVTTFLTLQLFEIGHALLNLTGNVAAMPSVITALRRRPSETIEQWQGRTSAWATVVDPDDALAMMHPVKLMARSTTFGFTPRGNVVWQEAAKLGYLRQEVAEIMSSMHQPHATEFSKSLRKVRDKLSYISNRSEEITRGWSHMAGYLIASENLGLSGREAHIFARKFADNTIGNYRPVNRPTIFQGAVGMPLGLFQTYMWNYMSRLFGYVENRDIRSLVTQYATQAAVFGAQGVPGFEQFNRFFYESVYQDSTGVNQNYDLISRVRELYGEGVSDGLLYGSLSNVSKLFGLDGISLYTRGDLNVRRLPVLSGLDQLAPVNLIKSTYMGMQRTADMFRREGNYSNREMAEILATYSISRPMRNLMEIGLGYSVDRRGQVIEDEVRHGLSIATRVAGLKPMMETKTNEAYARLRGHEIDQSERRRRTRFRLRAAMRGGTVDGSTMRDVIADYIAQGGNPASVATFFREQALAASTPRATQKFLDLLKGQPDVVQAMRLGNSLGYTLDED